MNQAVLIYDGNCGICQEWVDYWQKLGGTDFIYRPYQEVAQDYPDITPVEFEQAIQLVYPDGTHFKGAEATFHLYKNTSPQNLLLYFYKYLPGFAFISELFYSFFSQHRSLLSFLTHLGWGRNFEPTNYKLTSWVFLRLLGLIYFTAFASLAVQISGLIGADGILPLNNYLEQVKAQLGSKAYYYLPTIFWPYSGDSLLEWTCIAGCLLSLFVVFNFFLRTSLLLCYALYLSLFYAGQTFMSFQWDLLLLEAGFLAIFLTSGSHIIVWLYRWLVFRFMFLGGVVKIISQDPTWDNLTALQYHFETQPLPTVFAWYAHHAPESLLSSAVALTLIIELIVPFLIFLPRRFRLFAAGSFILFQSLIILTGNYNFFNILTIAICILLLDDTAIRFCLPRSFQQKLNIKESIRPNLISTYVMSIFALFVLFISSEQLQRILSGERNSPLSSLSQLVAPLRAINTYGPFAVMTTVRNEIVIEGTVDNNSWREYKFRYKPDDVSQHPPWVSPHQPRLDWQMWFAALSQPSHNPWFTNLLIKLLTGSEDVVELLGQSPFPDELPKQVRARFYRYEFTTPAERDENQHWWKRRFVGEYYPAIGLSVKPET